jgi:solute carrier family 66 (lysosomal lysine-arginine transporter), member 1
LLFDTACVLKWPIQTFLAIYFCVVDLILLVQYYYYRSDEPSIPPYSYTRVRTPSAISGRLSSENYRTLSTVAANVAAGAALAAQQEAQEPQHTHTRHPRQSTDQLLRERSGSWISTDVLENEGEADEAALSALTDSFHSEGGRTARRKRVSWSNERGGRSGSVGRAPTSPIPPSLQITARGADDLDTLSRGRSGQRIGESETEAHDQGDSTTSTRRTSSRASRRGASIVFLGVWALFSLGTLTRGRSDISSDGIAITGRVLSSKAIDVSTAATAIPQAFIEPPLGTISSSVILDDSDLPPVEASPSKDRVLGRIFAWLCTTLYLTSRLPQIWKNVSVSHSSIRILVLT